MAEVVQSEFISFQRIQSAKCKAHPVRSEHLTRASSPLRRTEYAHNKTHDCKFHVLFVIRFFTVEREYVADKSASSARSAEYPGLYHWLLKRVGSMSPKLWNPPHHVSLVKSSRGERKRCHMHRSEAATSACEDAGYLMALFRRFHLLTWRCHGAHSICECFGTSTEILCCGPRPRGRE